MIEANQFIEQLEESGHTFVSGVPCSFLTPFINRVIASSELDYVAAASEGEAVGINLGAYLAGRKTVTLCQNSGLGNMVNPLTSLNYPFRIPSLLIVTWRGEPGVPDEPQHELMGQITHKLLETIEVPCLPFPETDEAIQPAMEQVLHAMQASQLPAAFLMRKGSVRSEELPCASTAQKGVTKWVGQHAQWGALEAQPSRRQAISAILHVAPERAAIIATTGKTGRELYTIADREQHLYVVGGMGTASGIGLGVALNVPDKPVVVIDGDGAALMKLGAFATIGSQPAQNLVHVLLDNEVHDSTGGQATASSTVRFAEVAAASNYRNVCEADSLEAFTAGFDALLKREGPSLIHLKVRPGSMDDLGRPRVTPVQVKERFMRFLQKAL
jgi:phosphonopyruvate decarboxylase